MYKRILAYEKFSFVPISFKLESVYVSVDSNRIKKKKNRHNFFFSWIFFSLLESSETHFVKNMSKILRSRQQALSKHFSLPQNFVYNFFVKGALSPHAPNLWGAWPPTPPTRGYAPMSQMLFGFNPPCQPCQLVIGYHWLRFLNDPET